MSWPIVISAHSKTERKPSVVYMRSHSTVTIDHAVVDNFSSGPIRLAPLTDGQSYAKWELQDYPTFAALKRAMLYFSAEEDHPNSRQRHDQDLDELFFPSM